MSAATQCHTSLMYLFTIVDLTHIFSFIPTMHILPALQILPTRYLAVVICWPDLMATSLW